MSGFSSSWITLSSRKLTTLGFFFLAINGLSIYAPWLNFILPSSSKWVGAYYYVLLNAAVAATVTPRVATFIIISCYSCYYCNFIFFSSSSLWNSASSASLFLLISSYSLYYFSNNIYSLLLPKNPKFIVEAISFTDFFVSKLFTTLPVLSVLKLSKFYSNLAYGEGNGSGIVV